jgi:hypothetical protein
VEQQAGAPRRDEQLERAAGRVHQPDGLRHARVRPDGKSRRPRERPDPDDGEIQDGTEDEQGGRRSDADRQRPRELRDADHHEEGGREAVLLEVLTNGGEVDGRGGGREDEQDLEQGRLRALARGR